MGIDVGTRSGPWDHILVGWEKASARRQKWAIGAQLLGNYGEIIRNIQNFMVFLSFLTYFCYLLINYLLKLVN